MQGSGFRVQGEGSGFRVQGSGFRLQGSEFRVQGAGFRVRGEGEVQSRRAAADTVNKIGARRRPSRPAARFSGTAAGQKPVSKADS